MKKPSSSSLRMKRPSSSSSLTAKAAKAKATKATKAMKVSGSLKGKAKAKAKAKPEKDVIAEAVWMCQQLTDGKLKPEDLGRGYVLLRNEAKKWVKLPKVKKWVKEVKQPEDNYYHFMFGHVCGVMVDGFLKGDRAYKVLFSDEEDKHFFSCGVESGHFIRDGCNLFFDFLKDFEEEAFESAIEDSSDMKLLENLLVSFSNLPEETLAR